MKDLNLSLIENTDPQTRDSRIQTEALMLTKTRRPKYLDLTKIRLPVTGIASIFHRISGVLLFLGIPLLIQALSLSLRSPETFEQVRAWFDNPFVRGLGLILLYALAHHFFAGIRFLLLDLDIGLNLKTARASALAAILAGLGVFVIVVAGIFI